MDLAEALIGLGHEVSVLAPADEDSPLPPYVVSAGRAVPLPYNGSVARIAFGPVSAARVRRWITRGDFDVLHVHEPLTPSLSLLAVLCARGPVVATFHTAMTRSRVLAAAQGVLQIVLERITARIAVSELARKVQVEHLGGGAVEIPNGVAVAKFAARRRCPAGPGSAPGHGRHARLPRPVHEPRKGFPVLRDAFVALAPHRARACGCWSPGRATPDDLFGRFPRRPARPGHVPRPGLRGRTRRACCAASTSTWPRTPAGSPSA